MYFEEQKEGMTLSGWIATPSYSRSQADQQYFFVNGRSIRDKVLSHAVRQGYHDVLHHGRQPAYVIFFELDPRFVDVNVHPTKHEVRFRESRSVHNFIFSTVHHVLSRSLAQGEAAIRSQEESIPSAQNYPGPSNGSSSNFAQRSLLMAERESRPQSLSAVLDFLVMANPGSKAFEPGAAPLAEAGSSDAAQNEQEIPPLGYAIGQLLGVYILAQNESGLIVVDMHAAHERITYEQMRQQMDEAGVTSQPLLVPQSVAVSTREVTAFELHRDVLLDRGLRLEAASDESIIIRAVPALLHASMQSNWSATCWQILLSMVRPSV